MRLRYRILLASVLISILLLSGALLLSVRRTMQHERATRDLVQAVVHCNTRAALKALSEGADPNATNAPAPPPLTFWQCVLKLVHPPAPRKTTTNAFDRGEPLLVTAARFPPDEAIVKSMLQHGANANAADLSHETSLHVITTGGMSSPQDIALHVRVATALLAHGANVDARNRRGATPLMEASANAAPPVLTLLLAHGARVNACDNEGDTALIYALQEDAVEWSSAPDVAVLVHAGAEVNARDHMGYTALW